LPQGIVPELAPRVEIVFGDDQGSIEEDLLALLLGDSMAKPVLLGIAGVPLELGGVCAFTHACAPPKYTLVIYSDASCVGLAGLASIGSEPAIHPAAAASAGSGCRSAEMKSVRRTASRSPS
jgi:hypothetical protein